MGLIIKRLEKKDEKKAIQFAIEGMHFNWYMNSWLALKLYGRYFWYLETSRATQVIAAYDDNRFVGVLLAEIKGEKPVYHSIWQKLYIGLFDWIQKTFLKDSVGIYDETNQKMFREYCKTNRPDGEIIFLAADPHAKIKGVGSALLKELERREPNKKIYLYTDNACTYQFYEHRGFEKVGDEEIRLDLGKKHINLRCLLYSKDLYQHKTTKK